MLVYEEQGPVWVFGPDLRGALPDPPLLCIRNLGISVTLPDAQTLIRILESHEMISSLGFFCGVRSTGLVTGSSAISVHTPADSIIPLVMLVFSAKRVPKAKELSSCVCLHISSVRLPMYLL